MERVTGSFLVYDDVIRIEYECEMVAEYGVWELRKVNDVKVFVGEHRVYQIGVRIDGMIRNKSVWDIAGVFYEDGCDQGNVIDIHESIERDAIERLRHMEPEFDIPEGMDYE